MERLVMQARADQEHRDALDHQRWVEEESTSGPAEVRS